MVEEYSGAGRGQGEGRERAGRGREGWAEQSGLISSFMVALALVDN